MARLVWKGDKVLANVQAHKERALYLGASHILTEANKIAPIDAGILIKTSGVDVGEDEATVYYTQKYAVRLHENPHFNFQRGRQGKWLEDTIYYEDEVVVDFLQKQLKKAFK